MEKFENGSAAEYEEQKKAGAELVKAMLDLIEELDCGENNELARQKEVIETEAEYYINAFEKYKMNQSRTNLSAVLRAGFALDGRTGEFLNSAGSSGPACEKNEGIINRLLRYMYSEVDSQVNKISEKADGGLGGTISQVVGKLKL
jgi:hypothetical protein